MLWSRLVYGARTILTLGPISVLAAALLGIALGLPAGYYGGWFDEAVMRVLDALMAFPTILLYMIIISAVGASSVNVVIAVAIGGAPGIARLVRALTMDIRTREYVAAAKLRGDSDLQIMVREILPQLPRAADHRSGAAHGLCRLLHRHVGLPGPGPAPTDARLGRDGPGRACPYDDQHLARALGHRGDHLSGHRSEPDRRRCA
jgi:hypothetical protein